MLIRVVIVFAVLTLRLTIAPSAQSPINLHSPAFKNNEPIPLTYSGYGDFKSPPLAWSGIPKGARELALILEDPDVPLERFSVPWLAYNIPATAKGLPEGQAKSAILTGPGIKGITFGLNAGHILGEGQLVGLFERREP